MQNQNDGSILINFQLFIPRIYIYIVRKSQINIPIKAILSTLQLLLQLLFYQI